MGILSLSLFSTFHLNVNTHFTLKNSEDQIRCNRELEKQIKNNDRLNALRFDPISKYKHKIKELVSKHQIEVQALKKVVNELKLVNQKKTSLVEKTPTPTSSSLFHPNPSSEIIISRCEHEKKQLKMKHEMEIQTMKIASATVNISSSQDIAPTKAKDKATQKECDHFVTSFEQLFLETKSLNIAYISERNDVAVSSSDYWAYVPLEYDSSETRSKLNILANVLDRNPTIDVIGFFLTHSNGLITQNAHHIDICHWTVIKHREYYCSNYNLLLCDTTSDVFVSRKQHYTHMDWHIDSNLLTLDYFITMKQKHKKIVSYVGTFITKKIQPLSSAATAPAATAVNASNYNTTKTMHFITKHAITEILDRDTKIENDLCEHGIICDGELHQTIMGNTWDKLGTTMPPYFFKRYVDGFIEATKFLNLIKINYWISGGASLGLAKFGRFLPWDNGDIDFYVDTSTFKGGCQQWLIELKRWADSMNYIHPHTSGDGGTCAHYGVYAVQVSEPPTNVDDPYSMGLITFTQAKPKEKSVPAKKSGFSTNPKYGAYPKDEHWIEGWLYPSTKFLHVKSYEDIRVRVHSNYGLLTLIVYPPHPFKYENHDRNNRTCNDNQKYLHNCIKTIDGSFADKCIEHTAFFHYRKTHYYGKSKDIVVSRL
jgi:hypothetical protein